MSRRNIHFVHISNSSAAINVLSRTFTSESTHKEEMENKYQRGTLLPGRTREFKAKAHR